MELCSPPIQAPPTEPEQPSIDVMRNGTLLLPPSTLQSLPPDLLREVLLRCPVPELAALSVAAGDLRQVLVVFLRDAGGRRLSHWAAYDDWIKEYSTCRETDYQLPAVGANQGPASPTGWGVPILN